MILQVKLNVVNSNLNQIQFSSLKSGYLTRAKEPCLLYCLPITTGRWDGFMPFPRALVLRETQTASTKIWTQFNNSISYDIMLRTPLWLFIKFSLVVTQGLKYGATFDNWTHLQWSANPAC